MNKIKLIIIGISLLLLLSGCFQIDRLVRVNKDGSGTIEETVLMSQEFIDQISKMSGSKSEKESDEFAYHNPDNLKKEASEMGEGVKYVSSKAMKKDGRLGYFVTYSFEDVTKIRMDENPADNMMSTSGMGKDKEKMSFGFKKGKTAELTIKFPAKEEPEEKISREKTKVSDEDIKMMKAMYNGMKISVKVEVDGKIVKTNATWKDKNVITLSEMDFDVIMKDEKVFQKLSDSQKMSDKDMKRSMQKFKGFKTDMNREVMVKFK
ncbi:MAG: hypothetical protein P9L97_00560 [Candidatus Tenebribacter davisii]|nr:hypothetical protein [Candidatus Tenebribacter davisii]